MNPTFTIIIPHKDIPDLLVRCLKSIPVREDIQVIRAEVAFRRDQFNLRHGFCREHRLKFFLLKMPHHDPKLFKEYFFRLDEIYPSKLAAINTESFVEINDICHLSVITFI